MAEAIEKIPSLWDDVAGVVETAYYRLKYFESNGLDFEYIFDWARPIDGFLHREEDTE